MKKSIFIEKANLKHRILYNYDRVPEWINTQQKQRVEIGCPKCNEYWNVRYDQFLTGTNCPNCTPIGRKKVPFEEFLRRAREKHGDKYDYSKVEYKTLKDDITIICPFHEEFTQIAQNHTDGCGCPQCATDDQTMKTSEFLELASDILDAFEFHIEGDYLPATKEFEIVCKKCNHKFFKDRRGILNHPICPNCSIKSYTGENKIKRFLNENNIQFSFRKTYPDLRDVDPLSYDFYIPFLELLIEYNGIQHYKWVPFFQPTIEHFHKQQIHDKMKLDYANKNGIKFEIIHYKENVENRMKEILKKYTEM